MWMPMSRVIGASTTTLMQTSRGTVVTVVVKGTSFESRDSYVATARMDGCMNNYSGYPFT